MPPSLVTAAWSAWGAGNLPCGDPLVDAGLTNAVVKLGIRVPRDARTAETLGAEREGTGVVIDDGLILTIGYLLLEAESILVVSSEGNILPASVAGFDHATGFGLVRTSHTLGCRPLEFGDADTTLELHTVVIAAHPAAGGLSNAIVVTRRPFTGWWEYSLEDAFFTAPARDNHSGAALIDHAGKLIGIGSLWVGDALEAGAAFPGNMFVPVTLLRPILDELKSGGRRAGPARPWVGVYSEEVRGHVLITQVLPESPAARGGVKRGDVVLAVGGQAIGSQSEFYQTLWASGAAGCELSLQIWRNKTVREIKVNSIDRMEYLRPWPSFTH
jgi:serine protease Do